MPMKYLKQFCLILAVSLIDGKFCLFEHLDEYPLLISNFGMASKMKKYLYSTKLFTTNASNPNTKLTEAEAKTFNMIGPNGDHSVPTDMTDGFSLIYKIT